MPDLNFIRKNVITIGMVSFLVIFYSAVILFDFVAKKDAPSAPTEPVKKSERMTAKEIQEKETRFRENLMARPRLLTAVTSSALFVLCTGLLLNLYFWVKRMRGQRLISGGQPQRDVGWGLAEVVQVFVLLFFIDTCLLLMEVAFASSFHWGPDQKDFLLMLNSFIRDLLVAAFVVLMIRYRFRQPLSDIGLTFDQFIKNVRIGFVAYWAILPLLCLVLLGVAAAAQFFSYEPPPQPVVEIYLKETQQPTIVFFTFFVALVGPVIEEIFFRGFAYKALRTRFGARAAILGTAAIFASLHMSVIAFLPILLLGIFLAYLYEKTGSLVPSMTSHMIHNVFMVAFTLGFKSLS